MKHKVTTSLMSSLYAFWSWSVYTNFPAVLAKNKARQVPSFTSIDASVNADVAARCGQSLNAAENIGKMYIWQGLALTTSWIDPSTTAAGARSKNSAANHSTFQKTSELFSIGGGHVVPVVNNTTCFSIYKWLLFLLLFSSYFPLLSHSFLK